MRMEKKLLDHFTNPSFYQQIFQLKMSAYRTNCKRAKGQIETSDSQLLADKEGEGIGDMISGVTNFLSNHGSKIVSGADAIGKTATTAKNIFDAKKSYSDMSKAGEELEYI
ncbi:hypothetical protein BOX15_Mlig026964g4, partial [Macrostomum lignano]